MASPLFAFPSGISTYGLACFITALVVSKLTQPAKLQNIPTAGSTSWLGSWWAGLTFFTNALDVIQEGYDRFERAPFKVATLYSWMVILSDPQHIEELRNAPDDTLSFMEGMNDQLQMEYTMARGIHHNPFPISILRSKLNRNIGTLYPEVRNEIIVALDEILDLRGNEWKSIPVLDSVQEVVCRTNSRIFVGRPLCHDPEWIDLNIRYPEHVTKGALITRLFPTFLKHFATRFFTKTTQSNLRGRMILAPVIEERRRYLEEYGSQWVDKPNDLLSWLMDEAKCAAELTVESLSPPILAVSFAAIKSVSMSFTNVLFYLAAYPQYIQPLREEVGPIVRKEGWSQASLSKMRKVDSFLKECERIAGFSGVSLTRKAVKDYTFWDGTFVPKGTMIVAPNRSVHYDDEFYPNAHTFEPFRFSELHSGNDEGAKYHFVSTTSDFLGFGYGRHVCPGRFFAASQLKTMLAHVVMEYDIKLEDDAIRPQPLVFATSLVPNPNGKVMLRARVN